jgi:hypothetical protein
VSDGACDPGDETGHKYTHSIRMSARQPKVSSLLSAFSEETGSANDDSVCWHLLLGDVEPVQAIAAEGQQRLADFTGLHMTPLRWLHATVLLAGRAADLTRADMDQLLRMSACPPCWPSSRSTWRYAQRSGSVPRR